MECNLKELYKGCSKEITYNCSILNNDGRTTSVKEIKNKILIKPGF